MYRQIKYVISQNLDFVYPGCVPQYRIAVGHFSPGYISRRAYISLAMMMDAQHV